MVGGDFQKPLQLLSAYGYCGFEDDDCVNPSDAADGRPTDAIITFSEFFIWPCVDRPKVMDEGPDYVVAPVFEVLCWGYVPTCTGVL